MKIRNRATVPQGMLAPSGYRAGLVNPNVQSTTRPAGTLLEPSPGYDTVRRGKNRFQGKGPTGGFRQQEFAEDVGGTGVALSVVPGQTSSNQVTEWLPEAIDSLPEGSVIIADRRHDPGYADVLHGAYSTIPDMGDRTAERPLSKSVWLQNPVGMFRKDYREHPAMTLVATAGLVWLINIVARDAESFLTGYHPTRGVGEAVTAPPAAAAGATGDAAKDVADEAKRAVNEIGTATDKAVEKIVGAADTAVSKIENAGS